MKYIYCVYVIFTLKHHIRHNCNCMTHTFPTYAIGADQTICHTDEDKDGKDEKADTEAGGSAADMMNGSATKQRKLDSGSSSDEDDDGAGGRKMSKASTKSGKSTSAKKKSSKPVTSKVYSK